MSGAGRTVIQVNLSECATVTLDQIHLTQSWLVVNSSIESAFRERVPRKRSEELEERDEATIRVLYFKVALVSVVCTIA